MKKKYIFFTVTESDKFFNVAENITFLEIEKMLVSDETCLRSVQKVLWKFNYIMARQPYYAEKQCSTTMNTTEFNNTLGRMTSFC